MSIEELSLSSDPTFFPAEYWAPSSLNSWSTIAKVETLKIASYLTEPICKVREYFYTFYLMNETCKDTAQKVIKCAFLILGICVFSLLAPFTAPLGALSRGMIAALESKPYIYLERTGEGKILPENKKITLVSHNQCYMPAGYCITDGGVTPISDKERMHANLQRLKALNPDIICLYEVPDICDAEYLSSQLPNYPFLIPVAGVRAIGPSSMMFVASKYEIAKDSIEFTPFVKGTELTGRAQYSEKGVLSFDIQSRGSKDPIATIISTHLQHSEIPAIPEKEEKEARAVQMNKIANQIKTKIEENRAIIFTGDLNQEESELNAFLDQHQINEWRRDPAVQGKPTWGGDKWCADLTDKPASHPLTLDYTFIAGKAIDISTNIIGTGFSGLTFRPDATSDHDLLFSTITLS
jgi:endonuclease/exonuclease/phosphatase family metal-dependent hydrolase